MKAAAFIIFIFVFIQNIFSQDSSYIETNDLIDEVLQEPNEETDNSELYEQLDELSNNPIDINSAGLSELQRIPFIDLSIASLIISHRNRFGKYFSKNELYSIPDIPNETIKKILPFVTAKIKNEKINTNKYVSGFYQTILKSSKISIRSRMTEKIQDEYGFTQNKFLGSKYKIYNRILAQNSDRIEIGFLTDKDPGEKQFNDFSSFHLSLNNVGLIKTAVAGDYVIQFGQGLALWSPFGFSKGADAVYPVKKKGKVLKPYTSALENNFNRGLAASINYSNFTLTSFFSKNKFDANIDSISGFITSTPVDGFHRTGTEILKRKSAEEFLIGSSLSFTRDNSFETGILYYHSKISNPYFPSGPFDLSGTNFNYTSMYYDIYLMNFNLFGESAYNGTSVASIINLEIYISHSLSFITSVRSYPHNYENLHGFGFGEKNGAEQNEVGFYNGLKWRTPAGLLNFYFDQFKFPYASYFIPLPVQGNEFLINFTSKPLKYLVTRLRFKHESKEQLTGNSEQGNKIIAPRLRENFRIELIYDLSKRIRIKGKFEYNNYRINDISSIEEGYLYFQDLRIIPIKDLTFYGRIIIFDTDSFNSAIYEYENDLNGILSSTALFGIGIRWYLIFKYKLLNMITISAKYSETYKPGEKYLGTGYSQINGNTENRFGIQIDIGI